MKKPSSRTRAQAARLLSICASNKVFGIYAASAHVTATNEAKWLARQAMDHCWWATRRIWGSDLYAEAEALLRAGWSPE